jgi:hypothetical protein
LVPDGDRYSPGINIDSASSNGGEDSPPVRISARPRGFHQQGMGDCARNLKRFPAVPCLLNPEPDHMLHAFAVGNDLLGE